MLKWNDNMSDSNNNTLIIRLQYHYQFLYFILENCKIEEENSILEKNETTI